MSDYLPFERISYSKPAIASIAEAVWIWFLTIDNFSAGGDSGVVDIYTVPSGFKAVISDVLSGGDFLGASCYWIPGGDNIAWIFFEPYETKGHPFVLPPVALSGETIRFEVWNDDTIIGTFRGVLTMWRVPGSKPENPKKDEPFERFRVGDFSSCQVLVLPDGETLYLFHRRGEDKENYLRFKDYGKPSQKKLASFHLQAEEAGEILSTLHAEPQKVKGVLTKYEKRYNPLNSTI